MKTAATRKERITPLPAGRRMTTANIERCPTTCSSCNLRHLCLPCGIRSVDSEIIDGLIFERRRMGHHETLYRAETPFRSLYAVRTGFFKSYAISYDGREQVTGFHMAGEIIGLDGIETEKHRFNVEAMEDSVVCVIPYDRLEDLAGQVPALQRQFHRMMSREIVRDQAVMMLLGSMYAEERVVVFLLNLSQRYAARGFSATEFFLRATREEIGSYLGLKLETVSRLLSRLQQVGLIEIDKKRVRLLNLDALKLIAGSPI